MQDDAARSGFLNLAKPRDVTSHDVIDAVRSLLGANAGHGGTLDPMAEGVLVVATGHARRFLPYLLHDKEYDAVMRLGLETDTLDVTGRTIAERPVACDEAAIRAAGATYVGEIELAVPAYSAVKVGGVRMLDRALRVAGDGAAAVADLPAPVRMMSITALDITEVAPPLVRFRMACAGGTYVRSVVHAWGRQLGCGAALAGLTRTRAGGFTLAGAIGLPALRELAAAGRAAEALVPANVALAHLPGMTLDEAATRRAVIGQPVSLVAPAPPDGPIRLLDPAGRLLGVAQAGQGAARTLRMLPPGTALP